MYQAALPINLGFPSPAAFWEGVQVFVDDRPLEFTDTTITRDPIELPRLQEFQLKIYNRRGGIDLASSLTWQRQFALHGVQPKVISQHTDLGCIYKLPEETRTKLWDYADQRIHTDKYGDPSSNIQLIGLDYDLSKILNMSGPKLALYALEAFYQKSLLFCEHAQASLASLAGLVLLTSLPVDWPSKDQKLEKTIPRYLYAELCAAIARQDLFGAIISCGHMMIQDIQHFAKRKNVIEAIMWLVDFFKTKHPDFNAKDESAVLDFAANLMKSHKLEIRREVALGLSMILEFLNPGQQLATKLMELAFSFDTKDTRPN